MSNRSVKTSQKELLAFLAPYAWRALRENQLDRFHDLVTLIWLDRYPVYDATHQKTLKKVRYI